MTISPQPGAAPDGARRTITAVPITFNGIRYRSGLEADWAATLEHYGIHFEYEPQPYVMPSGAQYLPDFYLPTMRLYCEAKGPHNERLYKPQEFAAALTADDYPLFAVVVLRPAGPHGGIVWEYAGHGAELRFIRCAGCEHYGFAQYDPTWGQWFCRRCDCLEHVATYAPDAEHAFGPYLPMRHAPRKAA